MHIKIIFSLFFEREVCVYLNFTYYFYFHFIPVYDDIVFIIVYIKCIKILLFYFFI